MCVCVCVCCVFVMCHWLSVCHHHCVFVPLSPSVHLYAFFIQFQWLSFHCDSLTVYSWCLGNRLQYNNNVMLLVIIKLMQKVESTCDLFHHLTHSVIDSHAGKHLEYWDTGVLPLEQRSMVYMISKFKRVVRTWSWTLTWQGGRKWAWVDRLGSKSQNWVEWCRTAQKVNLMFGKM